MQIYFNTSIKYFLLCIFRSQLSSSALIISKIIKRSFFLVVSPLFSLVPHQTRHGCTFSLGFWVRKTARPQLVDKFRGRSRKIPRYDDKDENEDDGNGRWIFYVGSTSSSPLVSHPFGIRYIEYSINKSAFNRKSENREAPHRSLSRRRLLPPASVSQ